MKKGSLNSSSLLFERISLPFFSLYCLIFFLDQIQLGESLITPGFHVATMFVYAVTINMLKGLKTFAGLMVFMYSILSVGSFSLICLLTRSTMSELVDAEQELLLLNLCASIVIFSASYVFTRIKFGEPLVSKILPIINQKENMPKSVPALITLTGLAIATNFKYFSGELSKIITVISPLMFLVGWNLYSAQKSRTTAIACFFIVIVTIWISAGLSGMKSSLLLPLIAIAGAATMVGVRFNRLTIAGFAVVFAFVSVIAVAIQPLRNLKEPITNEFRIKLALAYTVLDLDRRYNLKLDINDRELVGIVDRLKHDGREFKKGSSAGILTRISYLEDDSKIVEAVRQKGKIPLEKYFEDIIFVPRSISGETYVTDKLSAFYGRYAEVIDRFDNVTGIAFSGHVISYAHGGYLFMICSMFMSVLFIFILVTAVFGNTLQLNDLSSLFALLYITTGENGLSFQNLWYLLSRWIPIIILTYSALYFAIQILSDLSGGRGHVPSKANGEPLN